MTKDTQQTTENTDHPQKTGIISGFKEFIARGNAVEMAVGIIMGAAFKSVVDALIEHFLSPLTAGIIGKPNFDKVLEFHLGTATIQPGAIITQLVNFLLVAAAIYGLIVVPINRINRLAQELPVPQLPATVVPKVLKEIVKSTPPAKNKEVEQPEPAPTDRRQTGKPEKTEQSNPSQAVEAKNASPTENTKAGQNSTGSPDPTAAQIQSQQLELLVEIRDLLAKQK